MAKLTKYSKLMSYILRHSPEMFGVALDKEGFVEVRELLAAMQTVYTNLSVETIYKVVKLNDPRKQRFLLQNNKIRANYGHSISHKIKYDVVSPPEKLFHGTNSLAVENILKLGIFTMNRQYVHLVNDRDIAARIGKRKGLSVIIEVCSLQSFNEGVRFYKVNDLFWLSDQIPAKYLRVVDRNAP